MSYIPNTEDGNQRAFFYFWNQLVTVDIKKPGKSKTAVFGHKVGHAAWAKHC
jgi:hypothetical protein